MRQLKAYAKDDIAARPYQANRAFVRRFRIKLFQARSEAVEGLNVLAGRRRKQPPE